MATLYKSQADLSDNMIPAAWVNEFGEIDMAAVTKEAHRLRGQAVASMVHSIGHSVRGMFGAGRTRHARG